jgi:RNA polymerase sigma-70 factor (ECF subfamily)
MELFVTDGKQSSQSKDEGSRKESPPVPSALDFDQVYEAQFDYVWGSLRRLGVRPSDLEDLTHDVFVVLHRRLAEFDTGRPVRPWLFGIAFRVASDYRRSARFQRMVEGEDHDVQDDSPSAEDLLARADVRRQINQALEVLDLDKRAVFVMHDLDGHSVPEIASTLGVPLNTAYSRLRLAREQFAASLKRIRRKGGEP